MSSIRKKIITIFVVSLLCSCMDNNTKDRRNTTYGMLVSSQHGETYKASDLNEKFIQLYNGNLDGKGLFPEHYDDKGEKVGAHPGYVSNIINLVDQFLDPSTQPAPGTSLNIAQYDVDSYHLLYNTPGVNAANDAADFSHTVSGLVLVPKVSADKIKGIIVYFHGTEFAKNSVPSCIPTADFNHASPTNFTYCNVNSENFNPTYTIKLGALFAAQGYIVFAPDYLGLGIDNHIIHPYVIYPEVNALSGIYGLQATKLLLQNNDIIDKSSNYKVFITGYSEGGAYALKTSQLLQSSSKSFLENNNLSLEATAPAEGAYSLSDVQMNFEFENLTDGLTNVMPGYENSAKKQEDKFVEYLPDGDYPTEVKLTDYQVTNNPWHIGSAFMASLAKPYLVTYALTAYGYYSLHNLASGYDQLMPRLFWNNIPLINNNKQKVRETNLIQFYNDTALKSDDILSIVDHTRAQKSGASLYDPSQDILFNLFIQGEAVKEFPISDDKKLTFPITLSGDLLSPIGSGRNNSASAFVHDNVRNLAIFKRAMEEADTFKWQTQSPIYFISCNYDSVVPSKNTDMAYKYMSKNSTDLVKSIKISNFQLSNELYQYFPPADDLDQNKLNVSKYWAPIPALLIDALSKQSPQAAEMLSMVAIPVDHTQAEQITMVAALCAFEQGNKNSICTSIK